MKQEYLQYAKRFETIGDLTIKISHMIKSPDEIRIMPAESYEEYQKNIKETIERFEYAKESISEVKAPAIIGSEHEKLVNFLGEFIRSIEILNESINLKEFEQKQYAKV